MRPATVGGFTGSNYLSSSRLEPLGIRPSIEIVSQRTTREHSTAPKVNSINIENLLLERSRELVSTTVGDFIMSNFFYASVAFRYNFEWIRLVSYLHETLRIGQRPISGNKLRSLWSVFSQPFTLGRELVQHILNVTQKLTTEIEILSRNIDRDIAGTASDKNGVSALLASKYFARAYAVERLGEMEGFEGSFVALDDYSRCLDLDSTCARAYSNRGDLYRFYFMRIGVFQFSACGLTLYASSKAFVSERSYYTVACGFRCSSPCCTTRCAFTCQQSFDVKKAGW